MTSISQVRFSDHITRLLLVPCTCPEEVSLLWALRIFRSIAALLEFRIVAKTGPKSTHNYRMCTQEIPEPWHGNPSRNVFSHGPCASLPSLYYTTQGARTMAVHRNPEMDIDSYATLETGELNYQKAPSVPFFSLMQNPHL